MLTHFQSGRTSVPLRALARLMAFVCLWMGTVSVAHHTDDAYAACRAQSAPATVHTVTPAPSASPCVACEWLLSLMPRISVDTHVSLTASSHVAFATPPVGHVRPRAASGVRPRGPPDFCGCLS